VTHIANTKDYSVANSRALFAYFIRIELLALEGSDVLFSVTLR
jgi:hypothetical protein